MSSKIIVYRVTNPGDGKTVLDRIDFNSGVGNFKDTKIENAFITKFQVFSPEAIGDNQSVEQSEGDKQPLGKFETVYILTGHISLRNGTFLDGQNSLIELMSDWEDEEKNNDNFAEGRMGIELGDMRRKDLIPIGTGTNQKGGMLEKIDWVCDWVTKPARANFVMTITVSKGDGT